MVALAFPTHCPHCHQPLPHPVRATALDAARALARLGGQGTAREVAASLDTSDRRVRVWLRQAEEAGLVMRVAPGSKTGETTPRRGYAGRERTVGRRATLWRANRAILAAYE